MVNNYFANQSETDPEIKFPTFLDATTLQAQTVGITKNYVGTTMNYVAYVEERERERERVGSGGNGGKGAIMCDGCAVIT